MEYRFSKILVPSEYSTEGLCEGLPVRKHLSADLEETGTLRAQTDWSEMVGFLGNFNGGLGPVHNFMAVCLPECHPDRLEIVSYANEFAFLHDDATDIASQSFSDAENNELLEGFCDDVQTEAALSMVSGKRKIQAKILTTMLSIDRERAMSAMKAWAAFVEQGAGRQHHRTFQTLEEYLPYRCMDVGHMFWHALATFGCALTIPQDEEELCKDLVQPAVIAASLTNDLFSYEKELEAARKAGRPDVVNALWIMMAENDIPLEEAQLRCRNRIKEEVAKYVQKVQDVKRRTEISDDTKRYVEIMQYSVSGNVVWSLQCPRYHKNAAPNPRQSLQWKYRNDESASANGFSTYCAESSDVFSHAGKKLTHHGGAKSNGVSVASDLTPDVLSSGKTNPKQNMDANLETMWDVAELARCKELPMLSDDVAQEPFQYLNSLPSKRIRNMFINGLNHWLNVPLQSLSTINKAINILHTASLLLDDIQDGSQIRRGHPSAHTLFGEAQTINTATLQFSEAVAQIRHLRSPKCLDVFLSETKGLFIGQSYDLLWRWEQGCPSVTEYMQMVDGKTGGMFHLIARLMSAESALDKSLPGLDQLCRLLGRYFQIRDDYQNLVSEDYKGQKGMCEDLDEGKYSLPIIHTIQHSTKARQIKGLLTRRGITGSLTVEQKQLILLLMQDAGSLEYTRTLGQAMFGELEAELRRLEEAFGSTNHELRLVLEMLKMENVH